MQNISYKKQGTCFSRTVGKQITQGLNAPQACCKFCKQPGHSPGHAVCPHYEPQKHLILFSDAEDVLSNFFPFELEFCVIKHQSAEHVFQYTKVLRDGDV